MLETPELGNIEEIQQEVLGGDQPQKPEDKNKEDFDLDKAGESFIEKNMEDSEVDSLDWNF